MSHVPGLRSPYDKVGRLVYFGRMLDKIRLHAAGQLPADYLENLGDDKKGVFDTRCCRFLRTAYADLRTQTIAGKSDDEVLAWSEAHGGPRTDEECEAWNGFLMKRGWHDEPGVVGRLQWRIAQAGMEGRGLATFFDFIDADEGRDPLATRPWEKV